MFVCLVVLIFSWAFSEVWVQLWKGVVLKKLWSKSMLKTLSPHNLWESFLKNLASIFLLNLLWWTNSWFLWYIQVVLTKRTTKQMLKLTNTKSTFLKTQSNMGPYISQISKLSSNFFWRVRWGRWLWYLIISYNW